MSRNRKLINEITNRVVKKLMLNEAFVSYSTSFESGESDLEALKDGEYI